MAAEAALTRGLVFTVTGGALTDNIPDKLDDAGAEATYLQRAVTPPTGPRVTRRAKSPRGRPTSHPGRRATQSEEDVTPVEDLTPAGQVETPTLLHPLKSPAKKSVPRGEHGAGDERTPIFPSLRHGQEEGE